MIKINQKTKASEKSVWKNGTFVQRSCFMKYIYGLTFLVILVLPFSLLLTSGDKIIKRDIDEKRILASRPDFFNTSFNEFSQKYENYLNDKLPFRTVFINNYLWIWETKLSSFVRKNIKGKEDHYFPNKKNSPTVMNYLGLQTISLRKLYEFRTIIAGRQAFWQSYGANYLFLLLPDKTTLYPEFLPGWAQDKYSVIDQLNSMLEDTQINYLNINEVLKENKKLKKPFFNKYFDIDHWNANALDVVYRVLSKKFENNVNFHQVDINKAYTLESIEKSTSISKEIVPWMNLNVSNLRVLKHNYMGVKSPSWASCDIVVNDKLKDGTLLFSTDSYFKYTHQNNFKNAKGKIFPLAHNVHKLIYVHYKEKLSVFKEIAHVEKPSIIIEAVAERTKLNITNRQSPRLLIAGEKILNDSQLIIVPELFVSSSKKKNCLLTPSDNTLKIISKTNDPILHLPTQRTNKKGRFVVMVKMSSTVDTIAVLFYAQGNEKFIGNRLVSQKIKKGLNYLHLPVYAQPDQDIRLRFDPGRKKAIYTIFSMPDTKEMFEEKS
ncbi:MAG: hypothetical protein K8R67_16045 [Desulfobacteraceae bacterium]|nr:hypothetical protein [Desulfobacteraceae bacterium]